MSMAARAGPRTLGPPAAVLMPIACLSPL